MRLEAIISSEGIPPVVLPPGVLKGNERFSGADYLFGFLPHDNDARWSLIDRYVRAKIETRFKPVTFEAALSSIYLSQVLSYRNGYGVWASESNLRQLCRAINNVTAFPILNGLYERASQVDELPYPFSIEFARTNRILLGTDGRNITGCPEATYQLRMFYKRRYRGRIGFNTHLEADGMIFSVTNVQGIPDGARYYGLMEERFGVRPFNYLIGVLKMMAEESPIPVTLRGLKNPKFGTSRALCHGVFKQAGIERVLFKRNGQVGES